jgi:hypothetical protein
MSEDPSVTIGHTDDSIDFGNADGERGLESDFLDVGKDFGNDMEWTGDAIGNTVESAATKLDDDTTHAYDSVKADIASGDYLGAAGDAGWGLLQDGGDIVAGAIGTVADVGAGLGAAAVAVGHDVFNVASDLEGAAIGGAEIVGSGIVDAAETVGSGIEDAAEAVGDGVESVVDDIEDLF